MKTFNEYLPSLLGRENPMPTADIIPATEADDIMKNPRQHLPHFIFLLTFFFSMAYKFYTCGTKWKDNILYFCYTGERIFSRDFLIQYIHSRNRFMKNENILVFDRFWKFEMGVITKNSSFQYIEIFATHQFQYK